MAASREGTADKGKTNSMPSNSIQPPSTELLEYYSAKILDCNLYYGEYKECRKWWSRVDQYFVYGQTLDCDHMKTAYKACKAMKKGDEAGKEYIMAYEKAKSEFRLKHSHVNDVWELRSRPNDQWSSDLNECSVEDFKNIDNDTDYASQVKSKSDSNSSDGSRIVSSEDVTSMTQNGIESKNDKSVAENSSSSVNTPIQNSSASKKGWCVIS